MIDSSKVQEKGKSNKKDPKTADSKPKPNQQASKTASISKKKKFGKTLCPYCEKGYHREDQFMRKELEEMYALLKHHNIQREKQIDSNGSHPDLQRSSSLSY